MATKPTLGSILWASDLNYSTGPAPLVGSPTKATIPTATIDEGWTALYKPPAQHFNYLLNAVTQWTEWTRQGSSTGAADAHPLETDANGHVFARGIGLTDDGGTPLADSSFGPWRFFTFSHTHSGGADTETVAAGFYNVATSRFGIMELYIAAMDDGSYGNRYGYHAMYLFSRSGAGTISLNAFSNDTVLIGSIIGSFGVIDGGSGDFDLRVTDTADGTVRYIVQYRVAIANGG